MYLPPKTERSISIAFSHQERLKYNEIERNSQEDYKMIKRDNKDLLSKHYLAIMQKLTPLRVACSGGATAEEAEKVNFAKAYKMKLDNDIECSICLQYFEDPVCTTCKPIPHIFCRDCITGAINRHGSNDGPCPVCRAPVKVSTLKRVLMSSTAAKEKNNEGTFLFRSKYLGLVTELEKIRDTEPNSKSLVFSQFTSTLKWMQEELPKRGFSFRTLSGDMSMPKRAQALREFQSDPPTTVFLLSMRSGAVGINLTQANRVFIMEPALNPALEAQAIGRVHRLGQNRPVEVIRLIIEDSIDTRLMKYLERKYSQNMSKNIEESAKITRSSSKKIASGIVMGHIKSDKAAIMEEEFDYLFSCAT